MPFFQEMFPGGKVEEGSSGDLVLKEHEAARWLLRDELDSVDWLPADLELVKQIKKELNIFNSH